MINNKLDLENMKILNNYQETGTVIYTGDGIAIITGLYNNVQAYELLLIQLNNVKLVISEMHVLPVVVIDTFLNQKK